MLPTPPARAAHTAHAAHAAPVARAARRPVAARLLAAAALAIMVLALLWVVPVGSPATTAEAAELDTTAPSSTTDATSGTTAHVRVTVVTTSDWAVVRLRGARLLGSSQTTSAGQVDMLPDGVRVLGPAGSYSGVEFEAVLEVLPVTADAVVEMTRGDAGRTRVTIEALDETLPVVQVDHTTNVAGDPTNRQTETITRSRIFGAQPVPTVHGDDRRLVLAFYYPWFGDTTWSVPYDDPRMSDRPADPRATDVQSPVDDMTAQAAANGIDGFIVSWAGQERNGYGFDLAQRAATKHGQVVAGYFETQVLRELAGSDEGDQVALARQWLDDLLLRARPWYAEYLRDADGTPVVFAYRTADISPTVWRTVLDQLEAAGTPIRLIGDAADPAYADVQGGIHDYSALGTAQERELAAHVRANQFRADAVVQGTKADIVVGSVAPGYDDTLVREPNTVQERGHKGSRYTETWEAALAAEPDWVTITSWNEWFEGTSVEPSELHGDRALQQTAEFASAFDGSAATTGKPEKSRSPGRSGRSGR